MSRFFPPPPARPGRRGAHSPHRLCFPPADNPKIEYGLTCTSGPLGGDAQVAALMCMEDLGALIFFTDPLSAHPHQVRRSENCPPSWILENPGQPFFGVLGF